MCKILFFTFYGYYYFKSFPNLGYIPLFLWIFKEIFFMYVRMRCTPTRYTFCKIQCGAYIHAKCEGLVILFVSTYKHLVICANCAFESFAIH